MCSEREDKSQRQILEYFYSSVGEGAMMCSDKVLKSLLTKAETATITWKLDLQLRGWKCLFFCLAARDEALIS